LKRQRRLEIVKCLLNFESLHATEIILNWDEGRAKNINYKINQFFVNKKGTGMAGSTVIML
jgi:hypothetical protein